MVVLVSLQATFTMQLKPNKCSDDTWSMVKLTHENLTDHKSYEYNIDGVTAENDCYYHCSEYFTNFVILIILFLTLIIV